MTTVTNSYISNGTTYYYSSKSYDGERAFTSIGSNLIIGSDFYFIKNLYFGFELGFGYNSIKYNQITLDVTNQVEKEHIPSYTNSNLSFFYNNAIRLGVWF